MVNQVRHEFRRCCSKALEVFQKPATLISSAVALSSYTYVQFKENPYLAMVSGACSLAMLSLGTCLRPRKIEQVPSIALDEHGNLSVDEMVEQVPHVIGKGRDLSDDEKVELFACEELDGDLGLNTKSEETREDRGSRPREILTKFIEHFHSPCDLREVGLTRLLDSAYETYEAVIANETGYSKILRRESYIR